MYKVFIGWDDREEEAFWACKKSIEQNLNMRENRIPVDIQRICLDDLAYDDYYREKVFPQEVASTQFAFSRFLVPYLCDYKGWAVFCDCDFIFTRDIREVFRYLDPKYSVLCCQHDYTPKSAMKMDGQVQTVYPRKNWSSMMLINCEHPDCQNLDPMSVSNNSGAWLHRMEWAKDENIGKLPLEWNWLVGEYEVESLNGKLPAVLHYTLGCPFMEGYEHCDFAEQYWKYAR